MGALFFLMIQLSIPIAYPQSKFVPLGPSADYGFTSVPEPFIDPRFGVIRRTSVVSTRDAFYAQMRSETKRTVSPFDALLKSKTPDAHEYKSFVKRNELIFGNSPIEPTEFSVTWNELSVLHDSFHLIETHCVDPANETHLYSGTAIAISENEVITANHMIDCQFINSTFKFDSVFIGKIHSLSVVYSGTGHYDDILLLASEEEYRFTSYIPLNTNQNIKPLNDASYPQQLGFGLLCIGYIGNIDLVHLKDGHTINKSDIKTYFGSSGTLSVSYGVITDTKNMLNTTCHLMVSNISGLSNPKCKRMYWKDSDYTLDSKYNIACSSNIIGGMSGGICVDARHPSSMIGVISHGTEHTIMETRPNGSHIKHTYSVSNLATLITQSSVYERYKSWSHMFIRLKKFVKRIFVLPKSEL
eukprot:11544_1